MTDGRVVEEPSSGEEDEAELAGSDSEGENADDIAGRPYLALIKSFTENPANNAKRRKLGHPQTVAELPSTQDMAAPEDEVDVEEEVDADLGDKPEEELEDGSVDEISEDEDQADESDPFETHFASPKEDEVSKKIQAIERNEWTSSKRVSQTSRIVFSQPRVGEDVKAPTPVLFSGPSDLKLKQKLQDSIASLRPKFDSVEQMVAPLLFQYYDTLFFDRNVANAESLRRLACIHAVNHVFKYEALHENP